MMTNIWQKEEQGLYWHVLSLHLPPQVFPHASIYFLEEIVGERKGHGVINLRELIHSLTSVEINEDEAMGCMWAEPMG
jgi:hypothetical protein